MKLLIAGSRDTKGPIPFDKILKGLYNAGVQEVTELVCGEARGADLLGKEWAIEKGIPVKSFPADWHIHGKAAGYIRNEAMADYCDFAIIIWDGESPGTRHMIDLLSKYNKSICFRAIDEEAIEGMVETISEIL